MINDEVIATVNSTQKPETFYTVEYPIAEHLITETMTVKFEAHENSIAGGIFEVRLVKE
jgi:hypothetical protein